MAERTDDGRRYMPKLKCPYGNHRFADVPNVLLRNDSELKRLSDASPPSENHAPRRKLLQLRILSAKGQEQMLGASDQRHGT